MLIRFGGKNHLEKLSLEDIGYDLEIGRIVDEVRKLGARRILIQMPDGLKHLAPYISKRLEKDLSGVEIAFSASPSWGACVLEDTEALEGGYDLLVHIGHIEYPFYRPRHRTIFIPAYSTIDIPTELIARAAEILAGRNVRKVAIFSTIQHARQVKKVAEILSQGFEVIIHSGGPFLVGCDYSKPYSIKSYVDGYVIISGGVFHALGLGLAIPGKPLVKIDPYENKAVDMMPEVEKILRKRLYMIYRAMDARTWVLIDGIKGQNRAWYRRYLKDLIEKRGGKAIEYIGYIINRETLLNIDNQEIDAYVILACPRIPTDDLDDFHKPVLTPAEARMALTGAIQNYTLPW
ncbi:MAG: diphthamide biosynthesis enzyme Dph2 [Desulfurococcales archaeon]|nr:diphthamide biosynthesis enzyme Dph2 [Desulfurococcales archaeon]